MSWGVNNISHLDEYAEGWFQINLYYFTILFLDIWKNYYKKITLLINRSRLGKLKGSGITLTKSKRYFYIKKISKLKAY